MRRLVYLGVISPAVNTAEFQIVAIGATNSTIYSTQSDYVSTDFTIPIGTREVNFSISNPTAAPITIVVVYTSVLGVDRPNQNLGQLLLYLGIGIIVASVGASCAWVFARYRRKAEDQSLSPPLVRQ